MIIFENRENASSMNMPPNAISVFSSENIIKKATKIKINAVTHVTLLASSSFEVYTTPSKATMA